MRFNILAFAAGILFVQLQPALPDWGWALAAGLLCLFLRFLPQPERLRRGLAVVACLAVGVAWAAWRADVRLADELPLALEGQDLQLTGVIAALPQPLTQGSRFEFVINSALTADGKAVRVPSRVMLSWYAGRRDDAAGAVPALRPGEVWQLTARLRRPHGNANPGGFDYEAWLLERDIRATGYIRAAPAARIGESRWPPLLVFERLRDNLRRGMEARLPEADYPFAGVLVALAIGDQRAIPNDLWTTFNRTGVTHLVSISGLHVTMVAALAGGLAGALWRRRPALVLRLPAQKAAVIVACLTALIYALLAGFAVPAQRTCYMLLVAAMAMLSGRRVAASRILALALLAVLLIDPWAVLAAGFWLSFGAVAALLYVGSARIAPGSDWSSRLRGWGLVQWTATLASLPVLLLVFQQFSLVSPLANALAIPLVSFVVTPLALLGAVLPWWPVLALAHAVFSGLMEFLVWCAGWPLWQASAAPLWAVLLAAGGVGLALLPRGVPGRAVGLVLLLPLLFWPAPRPPEGVAEVTVLDVGQGLATVVQTARHTLVYDPGPLYSAESDAGQRVVVPYLRWLGVNTLDMLVVTHRDSDHAGGASSVLAAMPVADVRSPVAEFRGAPCLAGQRWQWDGVEFAFLHPARAADAGETAGNHFSCVLRIASAGQRMLLTSDIEAVDEAEMLARDADALRAEVLLVPHHGSRTSSSLAFVKAVAAKEVIFPVGYRNRFGHPKAEVVERHLAQGSRLWRSDRDGAVMVRLAPDGIDMQVQRQVVRRYWHGR